MSNNNSNDELDNPRAAASKDFADDPATIRKSQYSPGQGTFSSILKVKMFTPQITKK
ncbi:hypothetical protein [Pseudoalteromonas sp. HM-SA03]|uniref:hypothetical protein n=1 Tax=Pseudoalteromonas sp. HM-SA03 TaxID=2029678 RepID=UPI0020D1105D|nr:hypothetical protein [Pseudoalteromonas sp. HM-SA03]